MQNSAAIVKLGLAQLNSTVGDLERNTQRIIATLRQADAAGCDIVAFPELAITGYPPEDLLLKPRFLRESLQCLDRIVEAQAELRCAAVVGFVDVGDDISNAAALIAGGRVAGVHHKIFLPTYSVFDEDRYFAAGSGTSVFNFGSVGVGIGVCEDIWYSNGPAREQGAGGRRRDHPLHQRQPLPQRQVALARAPAGRPRHGQHRLRLLREQRGRTR